MKIIAGLICFTFWLNLINAQTPISLEEAINYGLENHNRLKLDEIEERKSQWELTEFKSIGLPKINASVNYQYYFATPAQPVEDFISPSVYGVLFQEGVIPVRELGDPQTFEFSLFQRNNLSGQIELSSLIFDGSYIYGLKAAKLYKDLVGKQQSTTAYQIKSDITKAYTAVLIGEKNLEVLDNNLKTLEQSLKEITAIYESGFSESLDVDRIRLSLDNVTIEKENLEKIVEIGYNVLKFQMSYPLNEEIYLTDDLEQMVDLLSLEKTTDNLEIDYNQRPEYSSILLGQELNHLNYKRIKAGYLPSARAFINYQANLQRNNLFDNNETGWLPSSAAGIALNIPIFDGRQKKGQLEQIKLDIEQTEIQKQDFETAVQLQVMNAQLKMENAKNTLSQRKRNLDLNQKIYDKTVIKFREGVGSSIELTQAEASLYSAQASYTNALYELVNARMDLDIALGKI